MQKLPEEVIGSICSFIYDQPRNILSTLSLNREFYGYYQDESSLVWLLVLMSGKITLEKMEELKEIIQNNHDHNDDSGNESYRDCVFTLWRESMHLFDKKNGNDSFKYNKLDGESHGLNMIVNEELRTELTENASGLTIEMWVKYSQSQYPVLFSVNDLDWSNGFGLYQFDTSRVYMFVTDWYQDPNYFEWSEGPKLMEWTHLAGVFNYSDNTISIFKNGEVVKSHTMSDPRLSIELGMRLVIGYSDYEGGIDYFIDGEFTNVRLWTVARTNEEIKDNYNKRVSRFSILQDTNKYNGLLFNLLPATTLPKSTEDTNKIKNQCINLTPITRYRKMFPFIESERSFQ